MFTKTFTTPGVRTTTNISQHLDPLILFVHFQDCLQSVARDSSERLVLKTIAPPSVFSPFENKCWRTLFLSVVN